MQDFVRPLYPGTASWPCRESGFTSFRHEEAWQSRDCAASSIRYDLQQAHQQTGRQTYDLKNFVAFPASLNRLIPRATWLRFLGLFPSPPSFLPFDSSGLSLPVKLRRLIHTSTSNRLANPHETRMPESAHGRENSAQAVRHRQHIHTPEIL